MSINDNFQAKADRLFSPRTPRMQSWMADLTSTRSVWAAGETVLACDCGDRRKQEFHFPGWPCPADDNPARDLPRARHAIHGISGWDQE